MRTLFERDSASLLMRCSHILALFPCEEYFQFYQYLMAQEDMQPT